jgi:hypothetical protein
MLYAVPRLELQVFAGEQRHGPAGACLHSVDELFGNGDIRFTVVHRARGRDHLRSLGVEIQ